ncbi:MAG: hypothetical protein DRJ69_03415 [Thermoprotei archaeon]|nr:MAG: hypothetical protein DRJ69_03415 [Thermoprotei archaeon]
MSGVNVAILPSVIIERARKEAKKLGVSLEEYHLELISRNLDPKSRAVEYIKVSEELLEQARDELKRDNVRQAAEKVWGATALAVKAYAYWREGKRLASHGEMWEYIEVLASDIGEWVRDAWYAGNAMHICFYEGWCKPSQVEAAIRHVEKLVREAKAKLSGD